MNAQHDSASIERHPHGTSRSRAIVIGGSLAGLLAARVLTDHFDHVTILERDCLLAPKPMPRKGVPQARHLHVLLARGQQVLQQLFPGLVEELIAQGSPFADMAADLAWLTPKGWGVRCKSGIGIIGCSRDLLEYSVRCRLEDIDNVSFFDNCDMRGLTADRSETSISGVLVCPRTALASPEDSAASLRLRADLVIDASGRGSRAPEWLRRLGYNPPRETVVNAFLGYSSRIYGRHPALRDCIGVYVQPAPPEHLRGGALFPVEGDRWILTLAGYGRDYPPTDEAGFVEFARSLRTPMIYDAIKDAEPLSPIFTYRATENRVRHYELMSRFPNGFIVLGDAACAFNPVYAQGVTMAALGAVALDECLRHQSRKGSVAGSSGLSQRFQRMMAKINGAPWMLATSEDFRVPGCEGIPPGHLTQFVQRYFDKAVHLSTIDADARRLLLEVFNMLKPPTALFHPRFATRLLMRSFKGPFQQLNRLDAHQLKKSSWRASVLK
jgi:2-polyprenyl-6-methoxyphenol hydroxylase-like FAD-dependent oxidoreductase